jgi:hypothetical protein
LFSSFSLFENFKECKVRAKFSIVSFGNTKQHKAREAASPKTSDDSSRLNQLADGAAEPVAQISHDNVTRRDMACLITFKAAA